MDGQIYIRIYKEICYPVDRWVYRIDQKKDSKLIALTTWVAGGYSKDACLSKAKQKCADLKISDFEIIVRDK